MGLALLAQGALANAADLAVLYNGNSIAYERREVVGAVTRLYLTNSSNDYIEIPSSEIERFETDAAPSFLSTGGELQPSPGAQAAGSISPPTAAVAASREELDKLIHGAGERHQLDPDFINSVIRAESGFHPFAVSRKGAQGLMQLMPQTASRLGVRNAFDPGANVEGGTLYLRELLEKYNFDVVKALAAYNAGPGRVDQYRGVPPYYETQAYIRRIIRDFNRQKLTEHPELAAKSKTTPARAPATSGSREHVREGPRAGFSRRVSEQAQTGSR